MSLDALAFILGRVQARAFGFRRENLVMLAGVTIAVLVLVIVAGIYVSTQSHRIDYRGNRRAPRGGRHATTPDSRTHTSTRGHSTIPDEKEEAS